MSIGSTGREELLDELAGEVARTGSVDHAVASLQRMGAPRARVVVAADEFRRRASTIRTSSAPAALIAPETIADEWYLGSRDQDLRWHRVRARLAQRMDAASVDSVDTASDKIVSLLSAPSVGAFSTRGLVLGNVQSGKTTSFISVMAKAADAGYRLFIVLSGTTDSLRNQTQDRIDTVLTGGDAGWVSLTAAGADVSEDPRGASGALLATSKRYVMVVKKQPHRLRNVRDWLRGAGTLIMRKTPILVIDDEADSASIDVGEEGQRSVINGLIRDLLDHPRAAYLAYTATPFANLLIDPGDDNGLYPRDFIVDLQTPPQYFGAERIFGRSELSSEDTDRLDGLDVLRTIEPDEARRMASGGTDGHPVALAAACRWFLLATAARRVRSGERADSSMLVHTSMLADIHLQTRRDVDAVIADIRTRLETDREDELGRLRELYEAESLSVPSDEFGNTTVDFEALTETLMQVAAEIRVIVDDYQSADRLGYVDGEPQTVIVIGGNTLSRGLTLEGLCASYFVRTSKTYDALLQMGRWFGYRAGYEDLCRIWMPDELSAWFRDLALVEAEIRHEIRRFEREGITPERVGVRIRQHPAMAITSAAKSRHAVSAQMSYSQARAQTVLFPRRDAEWLQHNIAATRRFVQRISSSGIPQSEFRYQRAGFRRVPAGLVTGFLHDYRIHERSQSLRAELVERYIAGENEAGALSHWNVVFLQRRVDATSARPGLDLGLDRPVRLANRSPIAGGDRSIANLKSIISTEDRLADLDIGPAEVATVLEDDRTDPDDIRYLAARERLGVTEGLLCVHAIACDSMPDLTRANRHGLKRVGLHAVEHLVGISMFFQTSKREDSSVGYVTAPDPIGHEKT
ncbi:Z1 domain-containing protein [Agromyces sp. ZXT2-3]|uniref:Z1 domain-containing protein n=1 Tax=Agromyces sp. ZXT2-3 TaxID=3461152 RepID=UPI0040552A0C